MRRKVAAWGLVGALVLVLAGCGQTRDPSGTVDAGGVEAPTAAFLTGAAGKTAEATTGKIALTMTFTGLPSGSGTSSITATGAYDHAARQAQLSIDLSSLTGALGTLGQTNSVKGLDHPLEEVLNDGHLYLKLGAMGSMLGVTTPWVEITGADALTKQLSGSSGLGLDPNDTSNLGSDYLAFLQGVGGTVTEVGPETIDGVDTTHYKADVDLQQALAKVGDKLGAEAKKRLQDQAAKVSGTMPIEVWVGADGLVRRITVALDASSFGEGKAKGSVAVTVELTDVGQPVQISVPPADQVSTLDLGARLKGLMKGGGLLGGSGGN